MFTHMESLRYFLKQHAYAQDNDRYAKNDVDFLIRTLCHAFQL